MIFRVETECGIMDFDSLTKAINNARRKTEGYEYVSIGVFGDDGLVCIERVIVCDGGELNKNPLCLLPLIEFIED